MSFRSLEMLYVDNVFSELPTFVEEFNRLRVLKQYLESAQGAASPEFIDSVRVEPKESTVDPKVVVSSDDTSVTTSESSLGKRSRRSPNDDASVSSELTSALECKRLRSSSVCSELSLGDLFEFYQAFGCKETEEMGKEAEFNAVPIVEVRSDTDEVLFDNLQACFDITNLALCDVVNTS